jgi:hypothetical protein
MTRVMPPTTKMAVRMVANVVIASVPRQRLDGCRPLRGQDRVVALTTMDSANAAVAALPAEGSTRIQVATTASRRGSLLRSGGRFAGPEHDDFRADRRAVVKIDDVLVRQADAARRDVGANGPGFIGAVDAV